MLSFILWLWSQQRSFFCWVKSPNQPSFVCNCHKCWDILLIAEPLTRTLSNNSHLFIERYRQHPKVTCYQNAREIQFYCYCPLGMTLLFCLEPDFSTKKIISGWPLASGAFHPPFCCLHPKRYEIAPTHPYTWRALLTEFSPMISEVSKTHQEPTPVPEAKGPRKGWTWYVWGFVRQRWGTSNCSYAILKYPNMGWNQRFHFFGPVELWLVKQKGNQEHTTAGIWTYWTHKVKQTKKLAVFFYPQRL